MKKEDVNQKGVSRRSVLKGAAAVGAMASLGGLAMNLASPGSAGAAIRQLPKNGTR